MRRGSLEVIEFEPRRAEADAIPIEQIGDSDGVFSRLRFDHRTLTSIAAALAALALHAPLIAPLLWGGAAISHPPQPHLQARNVSLQWIVLRDPSARPGGMRTPSAIPPPLTPIDVTALPVLPALRAVDASASRNGKPNNSASLAAMYGRYVGQVQARIERAWLRPRTAIGAPLFQCQVQVDQDRRGRVGAVRLLRCNGDASWRLSLVHAIEEASPLPAPPAEAVFAPRILLSFRAMAYSPGAPSGAYQPVSAVAGYETSGVPETASPDVFQELRRAARARHAREVIRLRIDGSKVELEPEK